MGAVAFTKASASDLHMLGRSPVNVIDNKRVVTGTLVFSSSYATGGDTLDLKTTGLTEVTSLLVEGVFMLGFGNTGGLSIVLRGTKNAPLIQAFDTNGAEVANTTNLSGRIGSPVFLLGA